jgi:septum formation topological specificity factor MinE
LHQITVSPKLNDNLMQIILAEKRQFGIRNDNLEFARNDIIVSFCLRGHPTR